MSMMESHIETVEEILRACEGDSKSDKDRVEADLEEAEETLNSMKLEIHSVSSAVKKAEYNTKIADFKARIGKIRREVLLQGAPSAATGIRPGLSAEQRHADSLEVLRKARAQLAETEAVGVDTLQNLHQQRETIQRAKTNTQEVNQNINHSNKLLNKMSQWWRG